MSSQTPWETLWRTLENDHFQNKQKFENLHVAFIPDVILHMYDIPDVKNNLDSYQEPGTSSQTPWMTLWRAQEKKPITRAGRDLHLDMQVLF